MSDPIVFAKNDHTDVVLLPKMSNRHGAITGATGTGKTVTLQALAQQFSDRGIAVFMADIKGDLTGISQPGGGNAKVDARLKALKLDTPQWHGAPVTLWDVFGEQGHPVRATVSDMGPLLLARMLELNETQAGVLQIVFKIADDNGWLLLDLKDLRAMCQYVGENAKSVTTEYGNVSPASIGAIQRGLLVLEEQGGDEFFGEPMLNIADMMQTVGKQGVVNILAADKLFNAPRLYATFLLWLLSELWESLPEVGDLDQPKFVFFFDEAHLLFNEAPKPLLERIEQTVRLIRSKGVGVYFVTQNPLDIPDSVLAQLGNRVQHALRAFTPRDQKAVQVAAQTMRENKGLDIEKAITELEVGEALISTLDEKGRPTPTERAYVIPPASRIGPVDAAERKALMKDSLVSGAYEAVQDRESAYELLRAHTEAKQTQAVAGKQESEGTGGMVKDILLGSTGPRGGKREGLIEAAAKSAVRSVGSSIGRQIVRGILGGLLGGRR
jgi:DNA helicase HerA-like ATPase